MSDLAPLCDFPAGVGKVQTMADGSPRFIFDAEESANQFMTLLADCQANKRYLHIIIYDEEEFQAELTKSRPQTNIS